MECIQRRKAFCENCDFGGRFCEFRANRRICNSPSLAEDSAFCSPSLAEGVRGWGFYDLDSAKLH
ncbi:hypothetical protein [Helicobacter sp. 23-1045]